MKYLEAEHQLFKNYSLSSSKFFIMWVVAIKQNERTYSKEVYKKQVSAVSMRFDYL